MIINREDQLLIVHRRLFENDPPRFFLGVVEEYGDGIVKVLGATWARDPIRNEIVKKRGERRKILSLASGAFLTYQIDDAVSLKDLRFVAEGLHVMLTDGKDFALDLTERVERS